MRSLSGTATAAALLILSSFLAGCGGDGDDDPEAEETVTETVSASESPTETPTETPTTSAPTEVTTPPSAPPMDPTGSDITMEQVNAALLTPDEIAPGLVQGTWSNVDSPPPCDQSATPLDQQVPPAVEGGTEISTSDGGASLEEEISIYDTEDQASQAFEIGSAGLDCGSATFEDGTSVTIGSPADVTAQVNGASGVGTSTAWEVGGDGYTAVLVATLAGRIIMSNTFFVADGTDTSTLPAPLEVAAQAWQKALAN